MPNLPRDVECSSVEKRGRARALQRAAARSNRSRAIPPPCFASVRRRLLSKSSRPRGSPKTAKLLARPWLSARRARHFTLALPSFQWSTEDLPMICRWFRS